MSRLEAAPGGRLTRTLGDTYHKMLLNPSYRYAMLLLGAPVNAFVYALYGIRRKRDAYAVTETAVRSELEASGLPERISSEIGEQERRRHEFFGHKPDESKLQRDVAQLAEKRFDEAVNEHTDRRLRERGQRRLSPGDVFAELVRKPAFLALSFIPGILMYALLLLYANPYLKYIWERLLMSVLVIFGVAVLVFTILYLSPMNPAANILGEQATAEQIANFNRIYGLDQPYLTQLWNSVKGIAYFDLGKSFSGNEEIAASIARKFPVTLTLAVVALLMSLAIAIPVGILSATRPNSFLDYTFMFIALVGLSIPNFWQGLIFILNFSIKLQWLPATYNPSNWMSMIMPVIVLGTGLAASVARMTRSSTLEVINEDYIITAKAKGLDKRTVLSKHALRNAIIPILTVIGLQFGGMMGGAAVTEKVFNISGLGSYIVDKQYIPDIPAIMGGVVYTAITISLVNVVVDMMYAFFDPRIRTKMKQY